MLDWLLEVISCSMVLKNPQFRNFDKTMDLVAVMYRTKIDTACLQVTKWIRRVGYKLSHSGVVGERMGVKKAIVKISTIR